MDKLELNVTASGNEILVKTMACSEYIDRGFEYDLECTQSVIDLILARGSQDKTFVFYDEERVQVIIDDSKEKRSQDTALYRFKKSDLLYEWECLINKAIDQKQFIEFLKRRTPRELADTEALITSLQTLKLATNIVFNGEYDDNNNYNFGIMVKDAEANTRLPRLLTISIPFINESNLIVEAELELEVIKPKGEGEKPLFKLTCPRFPRYWKEAVVYEISVLKDALPGYHILAGSR